ncbi:MAG TPA: hypothetical protein PLO92_00665 [Anaerolineaceae bacterium]|jgi:hypothetical protein|nr:hypothetical protein [Anaerolineaceae bacterium]HOR83127.1 hypothetical protein [Anaerolineaceae bacterium]HPL42982.1 hypothetical protein [Anaerolineaceae bacterium]HPY32439.1 hypothetical protein [Anaerolineaceae bacterium]HQC20327.1 hypothetical protein [Anaerolineaceae bacterium]
MNKRLGFHYFQDFNHYQARDLSLWLPELQALNASWLVIKSPTSQAIPEDFIQGLVKGGIQPIVQFDMPVNADIKAEDLKVILSAYARWGVKYVTFFKSPNVKSSWLEGTWSQGDLVERFLDRYLPFVRAAEQNKLIPIFPALQPGGDYWDLSFLKKMLQLVQQRKSLDFSANLHMAVSAQTFSRPLSWGAGASKRWKSLRPYSKNEIGEEDHLGFNTWQWYTELVKSALNVTPKLMLFWFGASSVEKNLLDPNLRFDDLLGYTLEDSAKAGSENALPDEVLGCLFWLLSSPETDPMGKTAWFDESGKPRQKEISTYKEKLEQTRNQQVEYPVADRVAQWMYPIDHYLLLPSYDWGIPENILERVRPIIREVRPTIGFSLIEAMNARKVTVWNEDSAFTDHDIQMLREAGCLIDEKVSKSLSVAA